MKKTVCRYVATLLLGAMLLLLAVGCGKSYVGDARMGVYDDTYLGIYSFELETNGRGTFIYHSEVEGDIKEAFFFDITDEGVLLLNGTEDGSGVIGKNEYRGTFVKNEQGKYTVLLKNDANGVPLASFTQQ